MSDTIEIKPSDPIDGVIRPPGSKSITNRALVCAALAEGTSTLTGVLDSDPIREGTSASMVNGAINAFVMAAAIEMPRNMRINAVSPGVIAEAMKDYAPFFRGFEPVTAARAALAYAKSVEGAQTGRVYRVL